MAAKKTKKTRNRYHHLSDLRYKLLLMKLPPPPPSSRIVLYTSSTELLKCLGLFFRQKFSNLYLSSSQPIFWLRHIDHFLLDQSCQRVSFLSSGSVVFLYMLCRDLISPELSSMEELQASLLTCFYLSYCYIGHEISYPLMPFLVGRSKTAFWERCLSYIRTMSSKMMRINTDRQFYSRTHAELKAIGREDTRCDQQDRVRGGNGLDNFGSTMGNLGNRKV